MDRAEWLTALREQGERFRSAVAEADPATPVPSCPGWTMTELALHLSGVYLWVSGIVQAGTTDPPSSQRVPPEGDPVEQYTLALDKVCRTLSDTDPEAPAWNFTATAPKVTGFWPRRQAHETAIHRWDAELGRDRDFPPALASDGVGEVLDTLLARRANREPLASADASVRVDCTDTGDAWLVRLTPGQIDTRRVDHSATAPTTVRGPSERLYLALWGREPIEPYVASGDPAAARLIRTG